MAKWIRRLLLALGGVVVLVLALIGGLRLQWELAGEVAVLRALDDEGRPHETRLWVVDVDGKPWLRTGNPNNPWLLRVLRHPEVEMTRAGVTRRYRAVAVQDPQARERVNAAIASKYGFAEVFLRRTFLELDGVTPVRLDPLEPSSRNLRPPASGALASGGCPERGRLPSEVPA